MIISRAPVRITLGGGEADLKSYYSKDGASPDAIVPNLEEAAQFILKQGGQLWKSSLTQPA